MSEPTHIADLLLLLLVFLFGLAGFLFGLACCMIADACKVHLSLFTITDFAVQQAFSVYKAQPYSPRRFTAGVL